MAKLEYDKTGRLLFTKEMKEEYIFKILPDFSIMSVWIVFCATALSMLS